MIKKAWIILIIIQSSWHATQGDERCSSNDIGRFISDPSACERFFYCDQQGSSVSVYCPEGMWFNGKKGICDLPSNVKCVPQGTTVLPSDEENIKCPNQDTTFVTFVASKINCSSYYLCYYGRPFKQECIPELHWNSKKNRCDFPNKAQCSIQARAPKCPPRGQDLIPHPSECDYFYYCINGHASIQQCPFYHHWDVDSQSCKWKNRAHCVSDENMKFKKKYNKEKKRRH